MAGRWRLTIRDTQLGEPPCWVARGGVDIGGMDNMRTLDNDRALEHGQDSGAPDLLSGRDMVWQLLLRGGDEETVCQMFDVVQAAWAPSAVDLALIIDGPIGRRISPRGRPRRCVPDRSDQRSGVITATLLWHAYDPKLYAVEHRITYGTMAPESAGSIGWTGHSTLDAACSSNVATEQITGAAHVTADGQRVVFTGLGATTGLKNNHPYYSRDTVSGTSFKVAAARGGAVIPLGGANQAGNIGVHTSYSDSSIGCPLGWTGDAVTATIRVDNDGKAPTWPVVQIQADPTAGCTGVHLIDTNTGRAVVADVFIPPSWWLEIDMDRATVILTPDLEDRSLAASRGGTIRRPGGNQWLSVPPYGTVWKCFCDTGAANVRVVTRDAYW